MGTLATNSIYQVVRTSGDHEEYEHVVVATYTDKAVAKEHARLAQQEIVRLRAVLERWRDRCREADALSETSGEFHGWPKFPGRNHYDASATHEYGFASDIAYGVEDFKVRDALPKPLKRRQSAKL